MARPCRRGVIPLVARALRKWKKDLTCGEKRGVMDAIVLAGGYATRLWPITRHRPKMFLPVGESTVIDRVFEELEADDRVDTVYVSTNERFADEFATYLADAPFDKPVLSVEETTAEDEKLGVVGALAQLVEREGVDDDTIVVAGDNLISFDIGEFVDFFEAKGAPCLAAYDVGSREKAKSYGLVELDGDRVVDFQEKPDDPNSTLVSIACYAFTAETVGLLSTYLEEGNNPDEPGWFLQWLQSREDTHAFTFDGAWFDIGTPESYLEAVAWTLDGDSVVADDATLRNTTVGENVHVMPGAELVNAAVDGSVVFPGATVRDADVRNSIVDEQTRVEGVDLSGALIGAHTRLTNGE
jgi:glucose-1-phosphate thymidylyltransferase